jgi:hypothetical protein
MSTQATIASTPYADDRLHKAKEPFDLSGAKADMRTDPTRNQKDVPDLIRPR